MTMRLFLFLFSFFFSLAHAQEFLDPAVAFKPSVKALDGQTIELSYEIAKGYYLYRNAFRVVVDGEGTTLGALQIPKGKEKDDENFGKVEVYYKSVAIRVPVERNVSGVAAAQAESHLAGLCRCRRLLSAADAGGQSGAARSGQHAVDQCRTGGGRGRRKRPHCRGAERRRFLGQSRLFLPRGLGCR
jgi:thiol:disulfide interchange protein